MIFFNQRNTDKNFQKDQKSGYPNLQDVFIMLMVLRDFYYVDYNVDQQYYIRHLNLQINEYEFHVYY